MPTMEKTKYDIVFTWDRLGVCKIMSYTVPDGEKPRCPLCGKVMTVGDTHRHN